MSDAIEIAEGVDPHVVMAWIAVRNIEREIELGLRQKARVYKTASGGHIDSVTIAIAAAKRRGVDMNVVPGRSIIVRKCWCGTMFVSTSKREMLCDRCRKLKEQKVCAGCNGPCPVQAVVPKYSFGPSKIAERRGNPWMCRPCANRKIMANTTPEQRSEAARKRMAKRSPEQRSEAARKGKANMTPEQRIESSRKGSAIMTPEKLSEAIRKRRANMTPEQRSEVVRKGWIKRSPEQRSEAARKGKANMTPESRSAAIREGWIKRKSR